MVTLPVLRSRANATIASATNWGFMQSRTLASSVIAFIFLMVCLLMTCRAEAAIVTYRLTPETGIRWTIQYTVAAEQSDVTINEFTIYFKHGLYANLAMVAVLPGWDALTIEPDDGLPADGFVDLLALTTGVDQGSNLGGFTVAFDYLGIGRPGAQAFDIVDPLTFSIITSGMTSPEASSEVPEPTTMWLAALALALLLRSSRSGVPFSQFAQTARTRISAWAPLASYRRLLSVLFTSGARKELS